MAANDAVSMNVADGAVAGNLAGLDANGNLTDSGKAPGDFLEAPATAGSEGQVLTADGEGGASWQDPTGGDPTEIIDDTAGDGDTDKVWSADKSHELLTEINSKYEKPNTGIPASDMAEGVIPDITGKADKTVTDALQKDKAPVIIDHAEGNPIVLTDGADGLPIEGMKIHFIPKQDTSGGDPSPSHVCPISGWTGINVWQGGKNLFDIDSLSSAIGITISGNEFYGRMYRISDIGTINFPQILKAGQKGMCCMPSKDL